MVKWDLTIIKLAIITVVILNQSLFTTRHNYVIAGKMADDLDAALNSAFKEIIATSPDPKETEKITKAITEKAKNVESAIQSLEIKPTEDKKNEGVAGLDFGAKNSEQAVKMVVSSLPALIDGVQMKDWKSVLKGKQHDSLKSLQVTTHPGFAILCNFVSILSRFKSPKIPIRFLRIFRKLFPAKNNVII